VLELARPVLADCGSSGALLGERVRRERLLPAQCKLWRSKLESKGGYSGKTTKVVERTLAAKEKCAVAIHEEVKVLQSAELRKGGPSKEHRYKGRKDVPDESDGRMTESRDLSKT